MNQPADVAPFASALSWGCGYSQRHRTAFHFGCSPTHCAMYGGAPMAHCCSEPLQEKTRWVSWQVAGDSTAHTVIIRSTGFMPDTPTSSKDSTNSYETCSARFQDTVKESAPGESVFKRKPAPDLIRGESRFASRKRGKSRSWSPVSILSKWKRRWHHHAGEAPFSLKIDAEHEPRLVAFEVNKIKDRTRLGRTAPCLKAPG